jgi:hypothetical protein
MLSRLALAVPTAASAVVCASMIMPLGFLPVVDAA